MSRFFVFVVAIAAALTILRFFSKMEGTRREKVAYILYTTKRALTYRRPRGYPARHRYVRYA